MRTAARSDSFILPPELSGGSARPILESHPFGGVVRGVRSTFLGWEPPSRKIELAVGQDLEFIRINGTIMGALVGLILYLIGLAL